MRIHEDWLRAQGGVVSRRILLAWGNTDADIRASERAGALERVRKGWYAVPGAEQDVVTATGAGCALSCVSVLRRAGVWTLSSGLHLRPGHHRPRRRPPQAHFCPCPRNDATPTCAVDDLETALLCASRCCSAEELVVVLDSVVNLGLLSAEQVGALLASSPVRVRRAVALMDRAESGTETLARLRLRARGLEVRPQVAVAGVGRVDLLVNGWLVVEADSIAHHTSLEDYRNDRRRDRRLVAMGYVVVRLTHHDVVGDWAATEEDLVAIARRGRHRPRALAPVPHRRAA